MQCRLPRMQTMIKMPSVFSDATWKQIISACQSNRVPSTWAVGDSKMMTIGRTDYQIDIIGKNHDTYTAGGTAPLTFQMHDCYRTKYEMHGSGSNKNGWGRCDMRNTHLPAILKKMPSEVQSAIREVNKLTSAGSQSSTINTTADKLFLLSEIEIFGSITNSVSGEGTQYDYYKAGNSKVKMVDGSANNWWERSLNSSNSARFCVVTTKSNSGSSDASNVRGVSFAFCF